MKLIPIRKLIGRLTVSLINKLTFFLLELFCMPIIKNKNNEILNVNIKSNFFRVINIFIQIT